MTLEEAKEFYDDMDRARRILINRIDFVESKMGPDMGDVRLFQQAISYVEAYWTIAYRNYDIMKQSEDRENKNKVDEC